MPKQAKILTKKTERFSIQMTFDEALIRVWHSQVQNMAINSLYTRSNGKTYLVKRNDFHETKSMMHNKESLKHILNSEDSNLAQKSRVDKFLEAIDKRFLIYSSDKELFFIYSADLDKIYRLIRSIARPLLKSRKQHDNGFNLHQTIVDEVIQKHPCPSWFKPSGVVTIPFKGANKDPDEYFKEDIFMFQLQDAIERYTGVNIFDAEDKWTSQKIEEYKELRRTYKRKWKKKHKPWLAKNMTQEQRDARTLYNREYAKKNKESVNASKKKYAEKNREAMYRRSREWAIKNKDRLNEQRRERERLKKEGKYVPRKTGRVPKHIESASDS